MLEICIRKTTSSFLTSFRSFGRQQRTKRTESHKEPGCFLCTEIFHKKEPGSFLSLEKLNKVSCKDILKGLKEAIIDRNRQIYPIVKLLYYNIRVCINRIVRNIIIFGVEKVFIVFVVI